MFLNFMLSADKIFTDIFKFNFSGKDIDDLNRPFKPREDLAAIFVTYSIAKRTVQNGASTVSKTGYALGTDISNLYNRGMDALDKKNGKDNRAIIRNKINAPKEAIEDFALNRTVIKDKEYKNPISKAIGKAVTSGKKAIRRRIILKKMSRNPGETKDFVKRTVKMKHKETKRKFTSNYKFIKDIALGGAEAVLAIPIGVNYGPDTGLTAGAYALNHINEAINLGSNENKKKNKEYTYQLNDVIESVETVYEETNNISEKVKELNEDEKDKVRNCIKEYNELGINKYEIEKILEKSQEYTEKSIIGDDNIEKIINTVEKQLPDNISEKEKEEIKNNAINNIQENKKNNNGTKDDKTNKGNYSYNIDEIAEGINNAIIKYTFGEEYKDIGKSVEKISSVNSKEATKKNSFGKLIDINKFADTL